jgi:hypothetical protein
VSASRDPAEPPPDTPDPLHASGFTASAEDEPLRHMGVPAVPSALENRTHGVVGRSSYWRREVATTRERYSS